MIAVYFRDRDQMEPVTTTELVTRLHGGDVVLLDVRPEDEFGLGHLPGALNIPLRQLERRLAELRRSWEIVAYCRGPYCVLSFEAVAALRANGFTVRRSRVILRRGRLTAPRTRFVFCRRFFVFSGRLGDRRYENFGCEHLIPSEML